MKTPAHGVRQAGGGGRTRGLSHSKSRERRLLEARRWWMLKQVLGDRRALQSRWSRESRRGAVAEKGKGRDRHFGLASHCKSARPNYAADNVSPEIFSSLRANFAWTDERSASSPSLISH